MSTDGLIVLLHGFGSDGDNMRPVGAYFQAQIPGLGIAAPDAPERAGGGYQWFSIAGVSEANRPARVEAARAAFDATLTAVIAGAGFADKLERVVLVGFSQGSIMALDALASGRWPVAGVVAFSGRLASPEPFAPSLATRLLLVHGGADEVIPAAESVAAAAKFEAMGVATELLVLPGVPHTISPEGAARAAAAIAIMLGG